MYMLAVADNVGISARSSPGVAGVQMAGAPKFRTPAMVAAEHKVNAEEKQREKAERTRIKKAEQARVEAAAAAEQQRMMAEEKAERERREKAERDRKEKLEQERRENAKRERKKKAERERKEKAEREELLQQQLAEAALAEAKKVEAKKAREDQKRAEQVRAWRCDSPLRLLLEERKAVSRYLIWMFLKAKTFSTSAKIIGKRKRQWWIDHGAFDEICNCEYGPTSSWRSTSFCQQLDADRASRDPWRSWIITHLLIQLWLSLRIEVCSSRVAWVRDARVTERLISAFSRWCTHPHATLSNPAFETKYASSTGYHVSKRMETVYMVVIL